MIKILMATPSDNGWRVTAQDFSGDPAIAVACMHQSLAKGKEQLRQYFSDLGTESGIWQLEFSKALLGHGEAAIGAADRLAKKCQKAPSDVHEVLVRKDHVDFRSISRAFSNHGLVLAAPAGSNSANRLTFTIAAIAAFIAWVGTLLIFGLGRNRIGDRGGFLVACHGEWSNRSKHVLGLLQEEDRPSCIVVLGRPRGTLSGLRRTWEENLHGRIPRLVRPFNLGAGFRSFSSSARTMFLGASVLGSFPKSLSFRNALAMHYRCLLGEASAIWWRSQGIRSGTTIYGHTGLADTTGLEFSQHDTGTTTVHLMHGVSEGVNFAGRSTIAVCRCGHDAEWHEALGGYGRCHFQAIPYPPQVQGSGCLLLLTNYAHPMNFGYQVGGIEDELGALEIVRDAVTEQFGDTVNLFWKPHPVLLDLQSVEIAKLKRAAALLGYSILVSSEDFMDVAKVSRWVISTPSTAVIELLAMGIVPILLDLQHADPATATMKVSTPVSDKFRLKDQLKSLDHSGEREAQFIQSWGVVKPGAPLAKWASIERAS